MKNKLLSEKNLFLRRLLVAIVVLIVYVTLSLIPLPYIHEHAMAHVMEHNTSQSLGLLMMLAGGNLSHSSLLLVGLMPFMLVQMLMQVGQTGLIPPLKRWTEDAGGAQKLGRVTIILSMIADFVLSYAVLYVMNNLSHHKIVSNIHELLIAVLFATVGAVMLLYLSQIDTMFGLGNGMTYLIAISVMVQIFEQNQHFNKTLNQITHGFGATQVIIITGGLILLAILNIMCTWFQTSTYEIPLQFIQLDSSIKRDGELPFSLNVANIMPVILTSMLMNLGLILANMYHKKKWIAYFDFQHQHSVVLFCGLIIIMCYVCTLIQFWPRNISQRLQDSGVYVVGHAPGRATTWYVFRVLVLLSTLSAIFYLLIVGGMLFISYKHHIDGSLVFGISSILIVLGALIDIGQQIQGLRKKQLKQSLIK